MAGGATCVTHAAMQKMFRDMSRYRRDRRAYVQAHRRMGTVLTELGDIHLTGEHRISDCFFLCAKCGYLSRSTASPCAACHGNQWLDLNDVTTSETVRSEEENARRRVPVSARILAAIIHIFFFLGVTVGVPFLFPQVAQWWRASFRAYPALGWFWVILPCLVLGSYHFSKRHVAKLLRRFARVRPIRWHLPVDIRSRADLRKLPHGERSGVAQGEHALTAPLSGVACLGYKVSVLFDVHQDARPPEWILEESRNAPLTIAKQSIDADKLAFPMTGHPIVMSSEKQEKNAKAFLRQRGLYIADGDFWFYEAVLKAGDHATVTYYPNQKLGLLAVIETA